MRTHGWGGRPPASDEDAIARILEATRRCIEQAGASTSISDVAEMLHVTRQTVYRYFASTEDLLRAAALQVAGDFMDGLASHVAHIADPGDAVIELVASALERLPEEPYIGLLLSSQRAGMLATGITSPTGVAVGRSMFERLNIDWEPLGLTGSLFDEFLEHVLRTMQSLVLDPGDPPRGGRALRRHLRRWLWVPAMMAAQEANRTEPGPQ